MVTLSRIYTMTGDRGETSMGDGSRVSKDHVRVSAYGEVDELNAVLGLVPIHAACAELALLQSVQNDLFDLGADLCVPPADGSQEAHALRITPAQVQRLEREIDRINAPIPPITSFVLPGGSPAAAWLHLARTVCRRAERAVVTLMKTEKVNAQAMIYLNRLSDLLFVMARAANDGGKQDVLWVPGQHREQSR